MHRYDGRAGTVACRYLFQRQSIGNHAEVGAAPFFRHQHSEKAKRAHFSQFGAGKCMFTVTRRGAGGKALLCEVAGGFADLFLRIGQKHRMILSIPIAVASPPPRQMPAMPRFRPCVSSAASRVTRIRAPDAPMGWPSAQAPP